VALNTLPLTQFGSALKDRPDEPAYVRRLRHAGRRSFEKLGFPSARQEAWRFTDVSKIARTRFATPSRNGRDVDPVELRESSYAGCARLVTVDGVVAPHLSDLEGLGDGITVAGLADAGRTGIDIVEAHLGRLVRLEEHAFAALNSALFRDGGFVHVAPGSVPQRTLQLLHFASAAERPVASYPRSLVVVGESSQLTLVEGYVSRAGQQHLTCPVIEIVVGRNAVVDYYKVQQDSRAAHHLAATMVYQAAGSSFASHVITLGGEVSRDDLVVVLDGPGADCVLRGLYVANGHQLVDTHMLVEHRQPQCSSHELYKGIVDQEARAVFDGRILVHRQAQKTDAKQTNRNLLLSRQALVNSNPQLEILADDVRCTHASTVGQLDEDAIFYLRSRGLGWQAARDLLVYAFAGEIVTGIRLEPVREALEAFLLQWLPMGDVVRGAVT
jgi:Fe-S cluster assembly protein SufD